jgi:nucleotide-binding universal stress UspA family protein
VIVVGVDGSEASKEALSWALVEARLRQSSLRVVYAWLSPQIGGRGYIALELLDPELLRQTAQERLDGFVAEVAGESPDVELECIAPRDPLRRCWSRPPRMRSSSSSAHAATAASRGCCSAR